MVHGIQTIPNLQRAYTQVYTPTTPTHPTPKMPLPRSRPLHNHCRLRVLSGCLLLTAFVVLVVSVRPPGK